MSIGCASALRMWVITVISAACLLVSPSLAGVKDLGSHFTDPEPRGLEPDGTVNIEAIPLEFHKENTLTNDLVFDGFEDEDYIDFDKILEAGSDDYMYVEQVFTSVMLELKNFNGKVIQ